MSLCLSLINLMIERRKEIEENQRFIKGESTMNNDILFKEKDFMFSYRAAGVLIQNNKILLQRPKNDDYSFIGGHVSRFEFSEDALKREFMEELHAEIDIDSLFAVGETFWLWGKTPCHQIGLYYKVHLLGNDIPLDGSFWGHDGFDDHRIDMEFCWVPLDELKRGVKVYPLELIPHILSDKNETVHFVSNQINGG